MRGAARHADLRAIGFRLVGGDVDQPVGQLAPAPARRRNRRRPDERAVVVVQAAAVRRVEGGDGAALAALERARRAGRRRRPSRRAHGRRRAACVMTRRDDGQAWRQVGGADRAGHRQPRSTPSARLRRQRGDALVLERAAAVVESQISPTACPAACCAVARSEMWRKIPPTGLRATWTMESCCRNCFTSSVRALGGVGAKAA